MSRGVCDVFEMLRGVRVFLSNIKAVWEFYPKIKRLRYHSLKAFKALKGLPGDAGAEILTNISNLGFYDNINNYFNHTQKLKTKNERF